MRAAVHRPQPILTKFPAANAYLPLVCLLAAVGPAIAAGAYGLFTPEQAAWGLNALKIGPGDLWSPGAEAGRPIPPLYAWLLAGSISLPFSDKLLLLGVPSYLYAVLGLAVVYAIASNWYSEGTGLWTCSLVAFNPFFLEQVREGNPSLGILFWALMALWIYLHHLRNEEETFSLWTAAGSLSFAALLLSVGWFAFWLPVVGALNLFAREWDRRDDLRSVLRALLYMPTARAGFLVVGVGIVLASPWLLTSGWQRGPYAPWNSPLTPAEQDTVSFGTLIPAMSATLVLAVAGLLRASRQMIRWSDEPGRAALPVLWTLIAALAFKTTQPTPAGLLILLVPLNLLAVRTLLAVLYRRISDRGVLWLMLATILFYLSSRLPALQALPELLAEQANVAGQEPVGRLRRFFRLPASEKLSLHLATDLLVSVGIGIYFVFKLSGRNDRIRRTLFGGFVFVAVALATIPSLAILGQPTRRDDPWQRVFGQLQKLEGIDLIVYVGSTAPSSQLRFIVHSLFPELQLHTAIGRAELDSVFRQQGNRPLVLVTDPSQRLPRTTPITKGSTTVTLSQIHDGDEVIAYAPLAR